MKYWIMTGAGAALFILGLMLGVMHMSAPAASILFIIGIVLLVRSLDRVGKPHPAADEKGDSEVGSYQI